MEDQTIGFKVREVRDFWSLQGYSPSDQCNICMAYLCALICSNINNFTEAHAELVNLYRDMEITLIKVYRSIKEESQ